MQNLHHGASKRNFRRQPVKQARSSNDASGLCPCVYWLWLMKRQYQERLPKHPNECLTWYGTSSRRKRAENCDFQGGVMEIRTDGPTDRPTVDRTDRPSYRDSRTLLNRLRQNFDTRQNYITRSLLAVSVCVQKDRRLSESEWWNVRRDVFWNNTNHG